MNNLCLSHGICRLIKAYNHAVLRTGKQHYIHTSSNYFAWMLVAGKGAITIADKRVSLRIGDWFLPSPQKPRIHEFSRDAKIISVRFCFETLSGHPVIEFDKFVEISGNRYPVLQREAEKLALLTEEFAYGYNGSTPDKTYSYARQIELQCVFAIWLQQLMIALGDQNIEICSKQIMDFRVQRMIEYLRGIKQYQKLPYRELSAITALGRVQIDRLFKQHIKQSPSEFFANHLLRLCEEKLLTTDRIIKEIAWDMGFCTTAQFCSWFKKRTGSTPHQFRQQST